MSLLVNDGPTISNQNTQTENTQIKCRNTMPYHTRSKVHSQFCLASLLLKSLFSKKWRQPVCTSVPTLYRVVSLSLQHKHQSKSCTFYYILGVFCFFLPPIHRYTQCNWLCSISNRLVSQLCLFCLLTWP